jgi:hypothetical protein
VLSLIFYICYKLKAVNQSDCDELLEMLTLRLSEYIEKAATRSKTTQSTDQQGDTTTSTSVSNTLYKSQKTVIFSVKKGSILIIHMQI